MSNRKHPAWSYDIGHRFRIGQQTYTVTRRVFTERNDSDNPLLGCTSYCADCGARFETVASRWRIHSRQGITRRCEQHRRPGAPATWFAPTDKSPAAKRWRAKAAKAEAKRRAKAKERERAAAEAKGARAEKRATAKRSREVLKPASRPRALRERREAKAAAERAARVQAERRAKARAEREAKAAANAKAAGERRAARAAARAEKAAALAAAAEARKARRSQKREPEVLSPRDKAFRPEFRDLTPEQSRQLAAARLEDVPALLDAMAKDRRSSSAPILARTGKVGQPRQAGSRTAGFVFRPPAAARGRPTPEKLLHGPPIGSGSHRRVCEAATPSYLD
ncbi:MULTISPECIES: hypothetical protein [Rhodopseudomonas]|uniref:hypothetical protein n=1 Tax=Rhodopseudomonas TaxID=1073 RepID=UPI0011C071B3|nr:MULTISPECIES: hypothetical protein [Rhodopseudomonas]